MSRILFSSISKKFVMALAGLFLLTFLPVHLIINLYLLKSDPAPFNTAAHFMATFPVDKNHGNSPVWRHTDSYYMGNLASDTELVCTSGGLCQRQQNRDLLFLKIHDLDRGINIYLPDPPFLQFLFYKAWTGKRES